MGRRPVRVGVVDIGTNSMRLLITDGVEEMGRWVEVTGLGRGVDRTGTLSEEAMGESLRALGAFGRLMDEHGVIRRKAIATSASRDAANREAFFDRAETLLGVRPVLIDGEEEARYAYTGAAGGWVLDPPVLVCDIGGGSTELVTEELAVSVDIGSVRLTERALPSRPAPSGELEAARLLVSGLLTPVGSEVGTLVGVAGTWTSLAAIDSGLPAYDPSAVHGSVLTRERLQDLVADLAARTVEETAAIPALDPKRAPVILAGGVIASTVVERLGVDRVLVSERDSLDGVAIELLA